MSCKSKVLQRVCLQQGGSGSPQTPEEIIIPPELSVFAAFVRSCANREDLERTLTEIIAPRYSLLLSALDAWSAARSKNNFSGLADIERYNVALTDARQGTLSDLYLMMGVDQSAFPRLGMNREERARGDSRCMRSVRRQFTTTAGGPQKTWPAN